ncbi:MAG: hypothetical protein D8G53_15230, partial [Candidatus Saccharimonas sp.]
VGVSATTTHLQLDASAQYSHKFGLEVTLQSEIHNQVSTVALHLATKFADYQLAAVDCCYA